MLVQPRGYSPVPYRSATLTDVGKLIDGVRCTRWRLAHTITTRTAVLQQTPGPLDVRMSTTRSPSSRYRARDLDRLQGLTLGSFRTYSSRIVILTQPRLSYKAVQAGFEPTFLAERRASYPLDDCTDQIE